MQPSQAGVGLREASDQMVIQAMMIIEGRKARKSRRITLEFIPR